MCTLFQWTDQDELIIGKTYDVPDGSGMLFTNHRNIAKTAFMLPPESPAEWVSRYGSLTFSQVGKEFPVGGMNEVGLVIEQSTLWGTVYPDRDARSAVTELQWIQYLLDTCSCVQEVLQAAEQVRIAQNMGYLHYFVCDAVGAVAILEYLAGKLVIYTGKSLPHAVQANDLYSTSLKYLEIHKSFGGERDVATSSLSIDRFTRMVIGVMDYAQQPNTLEAAFTLLNSVTFESTQWQIVYQPQHQTISWQTQTNPMQKTVNLHQLNFSPSATPMSLEIDAPSSGAVEQQFIAYSTPLNRQVAQHFFTGEVFSAISSQRITPEQLEFFATYPDHNQVLPDVAVY